MLCIISFIGFGVFSFSITVLATLKTQGGFSPESALMSRCHRVTEEWNKSIPEIMGLWGKQDRLLKRVWKQFERQTREAFGSFLEGPVNEKEPWCTDLPAVFEEGAMCLAHYQLAQRRAEHRGKGVQQICCRQNRNRATCQACLEVCIVSKSNVAFNCILTVHLKFNWIIIRKLYPYYIIWKILRLPLWHLHDRLSSMFPVHFKNNTSISVHSVIICKFSA